MSFLDVVDACKRRWYVVLPLVLVTIGWAAHIYTSTHPIFRSSSVVGVTAPNFRIEHREPGAPRPTNGLLDSGGTALILQLASLELRGPNVISRVAAGGGDNDYTATMFQGSPFDRPLALMKIEATDLEPGSVLTTVKLVTQQLHDVVRSLQSQAGVSDAELATSLVAAPPSTPVSAAPQRKKAVGLLLVSGLGFAVVVGVVADAAFGSPGARAGCREPGPGNSDRSA